MPGCFLLGMCCFCVDAPVELIVLGACGCSLLLLLHVHVLAFDGCCTVACTHASQTLPDPLPRASL